MASDAEPTLILAHLFLGSKAHARDRELLQRLKITHILNVRFVSCIRCCCRLVCVATPTWLIHAWRCCGKEITDPCVRMA